eukprot:35179-Amphidinium_carterae.1
MFFLFAVELRSNGSLVVVEGETEWAEYEKRKVGGKLTDVAVEEACKKCFEFFQATCASWTTWEKFAEMNSKSK